MPAPHIEHHEGEVEELLSRAIVVMCVEPAAATALSVRHKYYVFREHTFNLHRTFKIPNAPELTLAMTFALFTFCAGKYLSTEFVRYFVRFWFKVIISLF